jgi:hypothetical protein
MYEYFMNLPMGQLESIRIRRMYLRGDGPTSGVSFLLARAGETTQMQNGRGGHMNTAIVYTEDVGHHEQEWRAKEASLMEETRIHDVQIYEKFPSGPMEDLMQRLAQLGIKEEDPYRPVWTEMIPTESVVKGILHSSAHTLTSLNLDWILWTPDYRAHPSRSVEEIMNGIARLRFPNLRAFQIRNSVVQQTQLAGDIYLLDKSDSGEMVFLEFMAAHPKLVCLAWPMDRFFSHNSKMNQAVPLRDEVVNNLARSLTDLRVDLDYSSNGELFTDEPLRTCQVNTLIRRRRFIDEFARHMRKVEQLKMEGGIPRDEKRETIRALRLSPLKKLVLIGVTCPLGNTWGHGGEDLRAVDHGDQTYSGALEEENIEAIMASTQITPKPMSNDCFEPVYGWPAGPPMLQTIAGIHASTIQELKFCGYNGSPILHRPSAITDPILHSLRYFHNLRQLVVSMWLLTWHGHEYRDDSIVQYWVDQRSGSTAVAVYDENDADENTWSNTLTTTYKPLALATQVANQIAPHLSPQAKARPEGFRLRASFCLGVMTGDIFDLDMRIGKDGEVLSFVGPREEGEPGKRKEKLSQRRWF